jgi:hypothetical protein
MSRAKRVGMIGRTVRMLCRLARLSYGAAKAGPEPEGDSPECSSKTAKVGGHSAREGSVR